MHRSVRNADDAHSSGGSCSPPLPPLPDSSKGEDDALALHLTSVDYAEEAMVIELTAVVIA
jgi:hypothetical protein